MQQTLFAPPDGSHQVLHSETGERETARQTIADLEIKGKTGVSIEEVEIFLKALAILRA